MCSFLDSEFNYTKAKYRDIKKYNLDLNISDEYLNEVRELILNNEEYGEDALNTVKRGLEIKFVF